MADSRKEYTVDVNGIEHTMLLVPEDAETLYGENAKEAKSRGRKASTAANKARTPSNKSTPANNSSSAADDDEDQED